MVAEIKLVNGVIRSFVAAVEEIKSVISYLTLAPLPHFMLNADASRDSAYFLPYSFVLFDLYIIS